MACTKEELTDGGRSRRQPEPQVGVSVGDAILLATICMVGMPVDVQARDGSVYSGIFHTASVDDDYAIVLKNAIMVKKGNLVANVLSDTPVETLLVGSEDLVQIVVKGDLFPSTEVTRFLSLNGLSHAAGNDESLEMDSSAAESINPRAANDCTFCSTVLEENVLQDFSGEHSDIFNYSKSLKIDAAQNISFGERKKIDCSHGTKSGDENGPVDQDNMLNDEVQSSNPSESCFESQSTVSQDVIINSCHQDPEGVSSVLSKEVEDQSSERPDTDDVAPEDSKPTVSVEPVNDIKSECLLSAVSTNTTSSVKISKPSKLNPGAKIFSPSSVIHRTTPPLLNLTNFSFMPGANYTVTSLATTQEDVDASSFVPSSVSAKYFPYSTVDTTHGGNYSTYVQSIFGQLTNRAQPVRYTSQCQNISSGTPYIHPNPQNIVYGNGRIGPVVFMQPVSTDAVQNTAGFCATPTSVLNPHQAHLSKHQRVGSAQALQVGVSPGQPPQFLFPASIPIPPPFPVLRPVAVPGRMGS